MKKKRVLVLTGGGDCPGLNAVIRGVVKRALKEGDWEVVGSIQSYNGVIKKPYNIRILEDSDVAGIHYRGGTILKTTNKGGPFAWPVKKDDGTWEEKDVSDELIKNLEELGIDAIISIGGDGSQKISQQLYEKGVKVIGVPKTIDNDLSSTDFTFGFQTAVEVATDAVDKLVTTAESHNRVFILEVMGRDAGWIALHSAIAGGAEVCLIPEVEYDITKVVTAINKRFVNGNGFAIVVVAEGAKPKGGSVVSTKLDEVGYKHEKLGGIGFRIEQELREAGCVEDTRVTVLGHLQRGGIPNAFDRILATQFGVVAFEMVLREEFGRMVAYKDGGVTSVALKDAIKTYKYIQKDSTLIKTARGVGMSLGD